MGWELRIRWIAERYEGGSHRALGRRIGRSGQAVSAWARGISVPSGDVLAAIALAYPEVRPRWLLTGHGRPTVGEEDEHRDPVDRAPAGHGLAMAGLDGWRSAYEAGRRDALREMRAMLSRQAPGHSSDGHR